MKPLTPEAPEKALLLVVSWRPVPRQVVCLGQPGFQWPKPLTKPGWHALARQGMVLRQLALALEMNVAQMPFADQERMLAGAVQFRGNRQAVSAREPLFYIERQK